MKISNIISLAVILMIISIFSFDLNAQSDIKRIEIEAKSNSDEYHIVPVGNKGVLIFSTANEKAKGSSVNSEIWNFVLYDINFKELWTKGIPVVNGAVLEDYRLDDNYIYLSFNKKGSSKNNFQLLKLSINSGSVQTVTGIGPNSNLNVLNISDGNLFVGGTTFPTKGQILSRVCVSYCACFIPFFFGYLKSPTHPLLYYVDFTRGKIEHLHPKDKVFKGVSDINTIASNGTIEVLFSVEDKKKDFKGLRSRIYDQKGKFNGEYEVKSKKNQILNTGFVSENSGNKFIIGTFKYELDKEDKKTMKVVGNGDNNGVYFSYFDSKGKQKGIKFYDFIKFDGFIDFTSSKDDRIIEKNKNKDKNVSISYDLLVHDPIYNKDEIIMVSEAYYAEYHYEQSMGADGKMVSKRVFDGYRTTHALVAAFTLDGDLKWSTTFGINILSFVKKKRIRVLTKNTKTVLAFSYDGKIESKVIDGNELLDISSTKIDTGNEGDKVKQNINSSLEYWYENFYIAYGYQKIKDKSKGAEKSKRKVFYFNKIQVD